MLLRTTLTGKGLKCPTFEPGSKIDLIIIRGVRPKPTSLAECVSELCGQACRNSHVVLLPFFIILCHFRNEVWRSTREKLLYYRPHLLSTEELLHVDIQGKYLQP